MADTPTNPPSSNTTVNPISGGSYVGDSIAYGLGQAASQPQNATVGMDSSNILRNYRGKSGTRYTVISAGTNDQSRQPTESNLKSLRESINSPKVIWIVPYTKQNNGKPTQAILANMQRAAATVRKVAGERSDPIIELDNYPSADGLHPQNYRQIVDRIKEIVGGVAGGDTPTPTDGAAPADTNGADDASSAPCDLSNGSPSFVDGEGGSPASTEPGAPVPPAAGLRATDREYITNQPLPPIPTNVNFNNAARNIRLSHYFTLHDILHPALGATSIPMGGKNAAGRRWTAVQLVQNLRDLCVLCLDPIKHRYRNVLITSTLRGDSNGSAHNVGWACDMQFGAHGKSGGALIDVANAVAAIPGIAYDQLLYEYAPTRCRSTWLHIGLRRPATLEVRGWAQSFYKDKPYGARGRFDQMPGLRR